MPRRDGDPTNSELLTSLETMGAEVYKTAFGKDIAGSVPAQFLGKRPSDCILGLESVNRAADNARFTQRLTVAPLDDVDAGVLSSDPRYRRDVKALEDVRTATAGLAMVRLSDEVRLDDAPTNVFFTSYRAVREGEKRTRFVGTFKDQPAKQTLYAAIGFTEEVILPFVKSEVFGMTPTQRLIHALAADPEVPPPPAVRYDWRIRLTPTVPLNGQEPPGFLNALYTTARARLEEIDTRLLDFKRLGAPAAAIEYETGNKVQWTSALERVEPYLIERGRKPDTL